MSRLFQDAEKGRKIATKVYKQRVPVMRESLLETQRKLSSDARFPVIVLFAGMDAAGKGTVLNLLNAWMDARWLINRAYGSPSQEERERPEFWRYWRDLPPRGRIGLFLGAWYYAPLHDHSYGRISPVKFERQLERIRRFETMLAADGALIVKFWLHLSRKHQLHRLRQLTEDPLQRWRVGLQDWEQWHHHNAFCASGERIIEATATEATPWHIVESRDDHYRDLLIVEQLHKAITRHIDSPGVAAETSTAHRTATLPGNPLQQLDLSRQYDKTHYQNELNHWQGMLNRFSRLAAERGLSTVVVFEGVDAAGKGGAIRRLTAALEARHYQVLPFAAPTEEERAHHYLWRFWRHLSRAGRFTVYDRSWYGRILVERVEGYAGRTEWQRAYDEINDFERDLTDHGLILVKFWLQIDKKTQLKRFQERESTPHKRWKLTDDDWRNRKRWDDYQQATRDMLNRTATHNAPWALIAANDKRFARIEVLKTLCHRLEEALYQ